MTIKCASIFVMYFIQKIRVGDLLTTTHDLHAGLKLTNLLHQSALYKH